MDQKKSGARLQGSQGSEEHIRSKGQQARDEIREKQEKPAETRPAAYWAIKKQ